MNLLIDRFLFDRNNRSYRNEQISGNYMWISFVKHSIEAIRGIEENGQMNGH